MKINRGLQQVKARDLLIYRFYSPLREDKASHIIMLLNKPSKPHMKRWLNMLPYFFILSWKLASISLIMNSKNTFDMSGAILKLKNSFFHCFPFLKSYYNDHLHNDSSFYTGLFLCFYVHLCYTAVGAFPINHKN